MSQHGPDPSTMSHHGGVEGGGPDCAACGTGTDPRAPAGRREVEPRGSVNGSVGGAAVGGLGAWGGFGLGSRWPLVLVTRIAGFSPGDQINSGGIAARSP